MKHALAQHIACEIPVVPVSVSIQIETVTIRVIWRIQVCEDAASLASTGQMSDEKVTGVHVGDLDALTSLRNRDHTLGQSFSVESSIYSPLPRLLMPPDWRGPKQNARSIAAIQEEGRKAKLESVGGITAPADLSLFLPFGNTHRYGQYGIDEPIPFIEDGVPERGDPHVQVVETEL
ncbi:MAG: hypothetical protein OXQ31_08370 [Spirochaetaceae bacterium]|nr:hypothetical protein [Spirochaetaceae bacterium]